MLGDVVALAQVEHGDGDDGDESWMTVSFDCLVIAASHMTVPGQPDNVAFVQQLAQVIEAMAEMDVDIVGAIEYDT